MDIESITDLIYGYFEDIVNDDGAKDWDDFVKKGLVRFPEDKYLWELSIKLTDDDIDSIDVDELKTEAVKINDRGYPDSLKAAVSALLTIL